MSLQKYVVLNKKVGETPLECAETWRATALPAYQILPLSYAGRLDPMASGKLLVLIGNECKQQEKYHALDKEYKFSVLFGVASDTHDVLGRLTNAPLTPPTIKEADLRNVIEDLTGEITLPFPLFSAKTVKGKPLHMWTLENRLDEIQIPIQTSTVYRLKLDKIEQKTRATIYDDALNKINSIIKVTDPRKALGNDFRRVDVRADWQNWLQASNKADVFTITHFTCTASSGTYMRSLAVEIGRKLGNSPSLAFSIHRTKIGKFKPLHIINGFWTKQY